MKHDVTDERLAAKHIVLLGVGHTNAHIVRQWGMHSLPDTDLTCISDNAIATYSGMLPAVLAQQLPQRDMQIDLVRLCASVGARLIVGTVTGLDQTRQLLHFAERPSIPFDVLSVGIGSVPTVAGVQIEGDSLLKIKPMQTFLERLSAAVDRASQVAATNHNSLKIVIAGSGAAGIEITFCLPEFLRRRTKLPFQIQLITRSAEILPGAIPSLRRRAEQELQRRDVSVVKSATIDRVCDRGVTLRDGTMIEADVVIWATGASPPELLQCLNLPVDERGFLATDSTLRSTSGLPIFAVGDTGTIISEKLPKAGVYAVRQGPILWDNVQAVLANQPLTHYEPQRSFLKLLNTGDGRAIGEWKNFSFGGRWVMKLKHRIDSKFMQMYRVPDVTDGDVVTMQCKGCGCKLGGDILGQVLRSSASPSESPVPFDSAATTTSLDDAAVIETGNGRMLASTDFFTNPVDDAFLFGRIAALHSASDIVAMGATATSALANVVVPVGDPISQQRALNDFLAGARLEFSAMGADIAGGHTIVGPRWEAGFTVIGDPPVRGLLQKQNLQCGDILCITKPLGIGVLLAAHMRNQCHAHDYELLIEVMLQRQHALATLATDCGITAATDITGFGLAGHLVEMLKASHKCASLKLSSIPLLSGVARALNSGIESSLAPQNRYVEHLMNASDDLKALPEYKVLFDPQTCGGLLLGVPPNAVDQFKQSLSNAGIGSSFRVGEVREQVAAQPLIEVH
ncbi:MAG: selenide, water dikinase SelD [Planctomycetaceae bacterium]